MNSALRLIVLVVAASGALALTACSSSGGGSSSGSSGTSSSSGSSGSSGSTSSSSSSSSSSSGSTSSGGASCNGDWTLGQNAVTSGSMDTFGQACNGAAPTNCPDGLFINKSDGSCVCIANCSSLQNVNPGDNCNKDGTVKCLKIKATNASANSATACVPVAWNLCTQ